MCDPAMPLLGVSQEEWRAETSTAVHTAMFTAAQLTTAKRPLTAERTNKMGSLHAEEYSSALERADPDTRCNVGEPGKLHRVN